MNRTRPFRAAVSIAPLLALAGPLPRADAGACAYDFAPLTALVEDAVATLALPGAVVYVERAGAPIYQRAFGAYSLTSTLQTASAAKWLSAAVLTSVVDSGALTLDSTTGEVLGWEGVKGTITLRQLFSHTSGFRDAACTSNPGSTLEACVQDIYLNSPLLFPPGAFFAYGGAGMQVAARMAEVAAGLPWVTLFEQRVRAPLQMFSTAYNSSTNPMVAGGASTAAPDYARMLRMFLNDGRFLANPVLSRSGVGAMLRDQTGGVPTLNVPPTLDEFLGYGVGNWLIRLNPADNPVEFASPGAFGMWPWIDTERNLVGVLLVQNSLQNVDPAWDAARELIRGIVDAASLAGDITGDGAVNFIDLNTVLSAYGTSAPAQEGDANRDGVCDFADLNIVLGAFGQSC